MGTGYLVGGFRSPRSNTRRVTLPEGGCVCWMRNASDGTVLRAVGEAGCTKKRSGRVRWPAWRA